MESSWPGSRPLLQRSKLADLIGVQHQAVFLNVAVQFLSGDLVEFGAVGVEPVECLGGDDEVDALAGEGGVLGRAVDGLEMEIVGEGFGGRLV